MAKKLRHALEIIWHNPTTRVVRATGHMVIDFFRGYIKPYKLQHNTLSSIGPLRNNSRQIYLARSFQPSIS